MVGAVRHAVDEAMHGMRGSAAQMSDTAVRQMHHFGELASDYARMGQKKASEFAHWTAEEVTERPLQTTLIAVGLGCLIAACFVRR